MPGSPSVASIFPQRIVVGVAELAVTNQDSGVLSTYALGSCVAVVAHDAQARAAGLLHLMLPDSSVSPEKAALHPAMFADTGIPALFTALAGVRARRERLSLFLAGGASVLGGPDSFQIGERNIAAVRRILAVYGCHLAGFELGGQVNRTLHLDLANGELRIKTPEQTLSVSLN